MNQLEKEIKTLIELYVEYGDIKNLDKAEQLFNENQSKINLTWEQLVESK